LCFADAGLFIFGPADEVVIVVDPIKNIVAQVIGQMSSKQGASFQDIQQVWARISGGQGSRAADFKDGCLTIYTDTSMRMVRLSLNRQSLLQQLNQEFPSVKKICFKVGNVA